jgi:hypothetical protein
MCHAMGEAGEATDGSRQLLNSTDPKLKLAAVFFFSPLLQMWGAS